MKIENEIEEKFKKFIEEEKEIMKDNPEMLIVLNSLKLEITPMKKLTDEEKSTLRESLTDEEKSNLRKHIKEQLETFNRRKEVLKQLKKFK